MNIQLYEEMGCVLLPSQISGRQEDVLYPCVIVLYIILGNVSYCKRLVLKKVLGFGVEGMIVEMGGCESEHGGVRYGGPE
jgi:hypothetical protein